MSEPTSDPGMSEQPPLGGWRLEDLRPSPNGSRLRRRSRLLPLSATLLGTLLGALVATSIVPRLHLRNLAVYNPWPRPVIAAAVAGALVGALRRAGRWWAGAVGGAVVGVVSLWLVYSMMRASQGRVLYVERSYARVFAADLARLAAYGGPSGALAGAAAVGLRLLLGRGRAARRATAA